MSRLDTKQAFIDRLLNNLPSGVTADDVAFENQKPPFNPKGKNLWLDTHWQEASSDSLGKTQASGDAHRGFFQIDINTPLTNSNFDDELLGAIDELASAFRYGSTIVYNTQKVDILESTSPNSAENGAWYRRFITINYLTFSTR